MARNAEFEAEAASYAKLMKQRRAQGVIPDTHGRDMPHTDAEQAAAVIREARRRRKPMNPNALDQTDALLMQARRMELETLGIGRTRASTFASTTSPLPAVATLFR